MSLSLTHFIRCYPNVLAPGHCQSLINTFEHWTHAHEEVAGSDLDREPHFTQINLTKQRDQLPYIHGVLADTFKDAVARYRRDVNVGDAWPERYGWEQFRMKRYRGSFNEQFPSHVDVKDYASARRFLVAFIYLNDDAGGPTSFSEEIDYAQQPSTGAILMFPPLWLYPHTGERPDFAKSKYIVGTYLHYL